MVSEQKDKGRHSSRQQGGSFRGKGQIWRGPSASFSSFMQDSLLPISATRIGRQFLRMSMHFQPGFFIK
jgi:hypothetical protein